MPPVLAIVLAWLLFSGTHLILATDPVRARLVDRFGERGFVHAFSAVAAVAFTILAVTAASFHAQGPAGLGWAGHPAVRVVAIGLVFLGFAIAAGSLDAYGRSPMALFSNAVRAPRGVEVISRHAFFHGLGLWAAAHVLLASTAAAAVFFGGFVVQVAIGAALQDRKLEARLGPAYRRYLDATSALPFVALLQGRARFVAREQPWLAYAVGLALAWWIRAAHAHVFDHHGAYLVVAVLGGAAFATWSAERAAHRGTRAIQEGKHG